MAFGPLGLNMPCPCRSTWAAALYCRLEVTASDNNLTSYDASTPSYSKITGEML